MIHYKTKGPYGIIKEGVLRQINPKYNRLHSCFIFTKEYLLYHELGRVKTASCLFIYCKLQT